MKRTSASFSFALFNASCLRVVLVMKNSGFAHGDVVVVVFGSVGSAVLCGAVSAVRDERLGEW